MPKSRPRHKGTRKVWRRCPSPTPGCSCIVCAVLKGEKRLPWICDRCDTRTADADVTDPAQVEVAKAAHRSDRRWCRGLAA